MSEYESDEGSIDDLQSAEVSERTVRDKITKGLDSGLRIMYLGSVGISAAILGTDIMMQNHPQYGQYDELIRQQLEAGIAWFQVGLGLFVAHEALFRLRDIRTVARILAGRKDTKEQ